MQGIKKEGNEKKWCLKSNQMSTEMNELLKQRQGTHTNRTYFLLELIEYLQLVYLLILPVQRTENRIL